MTALTRYDIKISIHALREEGDPAGILMVSVSLAFLSTPSARRATNIPTIAESDAIIFLSTPSARRATSTKGWPDCIFSFLSTPSARRATNEYQENAACRSYFYPRPPRGGRRHHRRFRRERRCISIHALREEGNQPETSNLLAVDTISIHALREEGDWWRAPRRCP